MPSMVASTTSKSAAGAEEEAGCEIAGDERQIPKATGSTIRRCRTPQNPTDISVLQERARLRTDLWRKLVKPAAAVLDDIQIVPRVHGDAVRLIELACQIADLADRRDDLSGLTLDDVDAGIVLVHHEHEGLGGIARESEGDRGAAALLDLAVRRHARRLPRVVEGPLEIPHLVVEPYVIAEAIADIDYAVIGERHAVHRVHAGDEPLAQEIAVPIEHQDAAVAIAAFAVGDVDVAVSPIDLNARGRGEASVARVERLALGGAVGGVEHALAAKLRKQLAAVVGVFLDHAARRACDPDVVVRVKMAGVQPELGRTVAQASDRALDEIGIAPGMDHLAGRVELDHQRREMPGIEFAIEHVLAIEKEHMVLCIDAVTAETARDPQVREGFWEGGIELVARRDALRPGIADT